MAPKMTEILLTEPGGLVIARPKIMWPPRDGVPDVIHADRFAFVLATLKPQPMYRKAACIAITGIDL